MTSHTLGPWHWNYGTLGGFEGRDVVWLDDDGGCDDPECCGGRSYHIEASAADKTLIAAAPELLEACQAALPHHQGFHSEIGAKLKAAIAKAEGR